MDDDPIRTLLTRLARPHPSGGTVIERAAIDAEGIEVEAVMAWIADHGGSPEAVAETTTPRGLHGMGVSGRDRPVPRAPSRFVLPAGALD